MLFSANFLSACLPVLVEWNVALLKYLGFAMFQYNVMLVCGNKRGSELLYRRMSCLLQGAASNFVPCFLTSLNVSFGLVLLMDWFESLF